ncbi:MAG: hypothetical protein KF819_19015 [Labilithrix sp.]|nr:hypothetical protein [Labilithrix sp.]
MKLLLVVAVSFLLGSVGVARADDLPGPAVEYCTVARKCSSTGVSCLADDRACTNDATSRGLEVLCEDKRAQSLVYCPPDTGRADSKIVWVLLGAATLLAVAGSAVAWRVLRKKA